MRFCFKTTTTTKTDVGCYFLFCFDLLFLSFAVLWSGPWPMHARLVLYYWTTSSALDLTHKTWLPTTSSKDPRHLLEYAKEKHHTDPQPLLMLWTPPPYHAHELERRQLFGSNPLPCFPTSSKLLGNHTVALPPSISTVTLNHLVSTKHFFKYLLIFT